MLIKYPSVFKTSGVRVKPYLLYLNISFFKYFFISSKFITSKFLKLFKNFLSEIHFHHIAKSKLYTQFFHQLCKACSIKQNIFCTNFNFSNSSFFNHMIFSGLLLQVPIPLHGTSHKTKSN